MFSGVGGVELGFARAGYETAMLAEIEPAVRVVLQKGFPGIPLHDDVKTIEALPKVDVVVGGFPCQDLSPAGMKAGIDGSRSGLVHEIFRLAAHGSVERIVLENVTGILSSGSGYAMDVVLSALERMGYAWAYRTVDMRAFGLPQRRRRVFFYASKVDDPRDVLLSSEVAFDEPALDIKYPIGFYWTEGRESASIVAKAVPTIKAGTSKGYKSAPALLMPDGMLGLPDVRDLERMQGFPEGWTEPVVDVDRNGRQKAIGNAVPPPGAEWMARSILEHGVYDASADVLMKKGKPWPKAAWNLGDGRHVSKVGPFPETRELPCISEFLKFPLDPLSLTATMGFLKRAREGCARFPPGFLDRIDAHAARMRRQAKSKLAA